MILVEPDPKKIGWAIVRWVNAIINVDVLLDPSDVAVLHIASYKFKPATTTTSATKTEVWKISLFFSDRGSAIGMKNQIERASAFFKAAKLKTLTYILDPSHNKFSV
jgi:hypothetical protein